MASTLMKNKTLKPPARILIVDDHALVRHGLSELISHETDLEVCGDADDADEAMRQIKEHNPDLVVVDISLRSSNGLDLIKQIKAHHHDVKILVSSMHDESLYAERVIHAGALGYINKHEAIDKVIDAIRSVLLGNIYLSPQMTNELLHRLNNSKEDLDRPSVEKLSDRELEVFELIGNGMSTREIADRLHLSIKTIETHREHIKEKLRLKNAAELAQHAVQWVLEES